MERNVMFDAAVLVLRMTLGVIFMAHGAQKLFGAFGGPGMAGVEEMVKGMGFTPPVFWAWMLALSEGVGGMMLFLGIVPRISAGFIGIAMLVAIIKVHGPKGLFAMQGGCEYLLLILASCISIILTGAGKFSLFDKF